MGKAAAVVLPQAQRRRWARCSVTPKPSAGRSNTCRAWNPITAASASSGAAAAAPIGQVLHDLIGDGDLGQMGAGRARLLARPAPPNLLFGAAVGPRGLAKPIRGRRLGRVRGVPPQAALQLGHPRLQRGDQAGLLGIRPRAARQSPRPEPQRWLPGLGGGKGSRPPAHEAVTPAFPWAVRHSYLTAPSPSTPARLPTTAEAGRSPASKTLACPQGTRTWSNVGGHGAVRRHEIRSRRVWRGLVRDCRRLLARLLLVGARVRVGGDHRVDHHLRRDRERHVVDRLAGDGGGLGHRQ